MLEQLSKNPEILSFLDTFPKHQWRKCVEGGLLYGIRKMKEHNRQPTYQDILHILGESQEDTIRTALKSMRKEIEELSGKVESIETRPRIDHNLKIPKIITKETNHIKPNKRDSPISSSKSKNTPLIPRQNSYGTISKNQDRKIPKYLKNVQSKIKEDVHKDIVSFEHKNDVRSYSATEIESRGNSSRELKEPNVMPLEKIKQLKTQDGESMKGVEDFLNNPFTSYLTGGYKYQ